MHARPSPRRRALLVGLLATAGAAGAVGLAVGSDHQDTPDVELNPNMDMADVHVFPGAAPGRIVLVMNSRAFLTPAQAADPVQGSFDPDLPYSSRSTTTPTTSRTGSFRSASRAMARLSRWSCGVRRRRRYAGR